MKSGLPIKSLQSLCDDFKQDIVDGPFGSELQRKDYISEGVPVLKIQNIKPFTIELKKMDYVSPAKFQALRRHSYRKGDIVMTKLGKPLGASAIVEELDEGVIVADLVRIRAKKLDTKYLCYHLNSQRTNDFINSMQKGTTRPRVTLSVVRELPIYVPSPAEQRRIVGILDEALEGIATAKANAEKNLKNARALFESHLQSVFTDDGKGWTEKTLAEVVKSISTGPFGTMLHKADYVSDGIPLVNPMNIVDSRIVPSSKMMVSEETRARLRNYVLKAGDVVIGRRGELGRCALITEREEGWLCGTGSFFVRLSDCMDSKFFVALFGSQQFKSRLEESAVGTTMSSLNHDILNNLRLPVPPITVQRREMARADELLAETERLESIYQKKLASLEALKKSLLHQAFTGQL